jgi:tetratricopeptide (TPR) repeat protein
MSEQTIEQEKQGRQLLKTHNYTEARQVFAAALLLAPDNSGLLIGMAETLRLLKDFTAAVGYYQQALERDPLNLTAVRGFGDAMRGLRQFEVAIEYWKKFLLLKGSGDVFVLTRIADCYKTINMKDESQKHYQQALDLNPHNRYALIGLADLFHKHGLELQAIHYYEKAIASGVTLINILTIVGNLYYRQGNYETAMIYYEKTLAQEPENSYALYGLGNCYRWKSDYRKAVELWERILEKNTGTEVLLTRLGDAYRNLGQFQAAERVYTDNLAKGYNKYSLVGMIKLHSLQSRMQEACDCYDELLRNEGGEDRKIYSDVGEMLIKRHEINQAQQFFCHVLHRQKEHPAVCNLIEDRLKSLEAYAE